MSVLVGSWIGGGDGFNLTFSICQAVTGCLPPVQIQIILCLSVCALMFWFGLAEYNVFCWPGLPIATTIPVKRVSVAETAHTEFPHSRESTADHFIVAN